jgi:hypothetical protein
VRYVTAGLVGGGVLGGTVTVAVAGLLHFRTDAAVVVWEFAIATGGVAAGIFLGAVRWTMRADLASGGDER